MRQVFFCSVLSTQSFHEEPLGIINLDVSSRKAGLDLKKWCVLLTTRLLKAVVGGLILHLIDIGIAPQGI